MIEMWSHVTNNVNRRCKREEKVRMGRSASFQITETLQVYIHGESNEYRESAFGGYCA